MKRLIIIMEGFKVLFCSSNFPWACERIFFEMYGQFGHTPSKSFVIPVPDHKLASALKPSSV